MECKTGSRGEKRGKCERKNNNMQRGRRSRGRRRSMRECGEEEEEEGRWMCNLPLYLIWPEVSPHKRFRPSGNKQQHLSCMSMTSQEKRGAATTARNGSGRRTEVPTFSNKPREALMSRLDVGSDESVLKLSALGRRFQTQNQRGFIDSSEKNGHHGMRTSDCWSCHSF